MSERLDAEVLHSYAEQFNGYGSFRAPVWFVGMEEGGGDTLEAVRRRLEAWVERGKQELEDLAAFHRAIGVGEWFDGDHPRIQPTWGRLIRVLLTAAGSDPSREDVRRYQSEQLGRSGGETALLELLPLPSRSLGHWTSSEWSSLPRLAGRGEYRRHYAPRRAEYLRQKREKHRPAVVVYYGLSHDYQRWWNQISGVPLDDVQEGTQRTRIGTDGRTVFVVMPHPAARGLTTEFLHRLGRTIADMREGGSSERDFG